MPFITIAISDAFEHFILTLTLSKSKTTLKSYKQDISKHKLFTIDSTSTCKSPTTQHTAIHLHNMIYYYLPNASNIYKTVTFQHFCKTLAQLPQQSHIRTAGRWAFQELHQDFQLQPASIDSITKFLRSEFTHALHSARFCAIVQIQKHCFIKKSRKDTRYKIHCQSSNRISFSRLINRGVRITPHNPSELKQTPTHCCPKNYSSCPSWSR